MAHSKRKREHCEREDYEARRALVYISDWTNKRIEKLIDCGSYTMLAHSLSRAESMSGAQHRCAH